MSNHLFLNIYVHIHHTYMYAAVLSSRTCSFLIVQQCMLMQMVIYANGSSAEIAAGGFG